MQEPDVSDDEDSEDMVKEGEDDSDPHNAVENMDTDEENNGENPDEVGSRDSG